MVAADGCGHGDDDDDDATWGPAMSPSTRGPYLARRHKSQAR